MDEAALTGMTLTASTPTLERSEEACAAAADELSALGACAHARPEPLHVKTIGRRRFGRLVYERLTFEHDPLLPPSLAGSGLGGPATAAVHLCRQGDDRRPWLVWVHGAGQGQPLDLLFSGARRIQSELGFNIALPVQPGHGVRREAWPAYPNMDPLANVAGMMRAVSEVRAVVRWLQPRSTAIAVSGVSMGSPVAALVSHLETVDAVAVYTPIFGLNAMIAQHLGRGARRSATSAMYCDRRLSRGWRHRSICWLPSRRRRLSVASSSALRTTGWRCASPLSSCTSGGVGNCTGTTAAMPGTSSPDVCRRCRSGSLARSARKAAADCAGDLLGVADQQVDPYLAL